MKKTGIAVTVVLLILVVVIGLLLTQSSNPAIAVYAQESLQNPKAEKIIEIAVEQNINGEIRSGEVQVRFEDPEGLPDTGERAIGVFLERKDDVITLGTGNITVEVGVEIINNEAPVRTTDVSYSGDTVEIMLTPDTAFYADITPEPEIDDADLASGAKLVTSTIVSGSSEAIDQGMILRVWGPVHDGRIRADIVVYEAVDW